MIQYNHNLPIYLHIYNFQSYSQRCLFDHGDDKVLKLWKAWVLKTGTLTYHKRF